MAIRSLLDEGVSEPKATGQRPVVTKSTMSEKIHDMVMDTAQASMALKLLGFNPGDSVAKQSAAPEYAAMFNGQNQLLQTLLTQLTTLSSKAQDSQTKAEIGELKGTVQDLVKALSQPGDPLETFAKNYAVLETITEKLHKKAAADGTQVPGIDQAGLAAMPIYLQMEQLKLDGQDRQRTHELTLAQMRRQWVKEDRMATQQFDMERKRFELEVTTANKKVDQLSALVGAVLQGLDLNKLLTRDTPSVAARTTREPAAPVSLGTRPREFECGTCGQTVTVPSSDAASVECPTCGAFFDLAQFDAPLPAEAAPSAVPAGAVAEPQRELAP